MNGNNLIVYLGSTAIASCKSNEITTNCETVAVSSPDSGEWQHAIAGRKSWAVNASYLVTNAARISDLLTVGNTYTLTFRDRSNTTSVSGEAICVSCVITAIRGNLVQGSFSWIGAGELS